MIGLLAVLSLFACSVPGPPRLLLITHVAVVDAASGRLETDRTIEILQDRIVDVRASSTAPVPRDAIVFDGTGEFAIPGLWDMHVHTFFGDWLPGGRQVTLPLLLAFGVTGVRDMGSDLEPVLDARRKIAEGTLLAPRLVASGPMLDGPRSQFPASISLATPEDGRRAVAMLAGRGVDFIKIQSYVPHDVYLAVADECRRRGLVFVGHVPDAVRASEAVAAGQKSFEHLIGIFEGSSTAEDDFVRGGKKGPARFLETYDERRETTLIALLARNRVWQCPTLFWERGQWLVDSIDISKDPDLAYAPAFWREKAWPRFRADIEKNLDMDPIPVREKFVAHELAIVRRLHAAGVPLLAGTDTPAGVGVVPGASLHRELERLVAAGLTPLGALQTATVNPARFLGRTADFGAVAKGKIADLVLLDANPLDDIRNTRRIAAVVTNGRYLDREQIEAMRKNVAAYAGNH